MKGFSQQANTLKNFSQRFFFGDTAKDLDSWEMSVAIGENKEKDEYEADRWSK